MFKTCSSKKTNLIYDDYKLIANWLENKYDYKLFISPMKYNQWYSSISYVITSYGWQNVKSFLNSQNMDTKNLFIPFL